MDAIAEREGNRAECDGRGPATSSAQMRKRDQILASFNPSEFKHRLVGTRCNVSRLESPASWRCLRSASSRCMLISAWVCRASCSALA